MKWEIERYNWASIGDDLADMPNTIGRLLGATDRPEAERMYWRIDSVVVRNGGLLPGAPEVCECLVQGLLSATSVSREQVLELLVQIGGGEAGPSIAGTALFDGVRHQLLLGLPDTPNSSRSEIGLRGFTALTSCQFVHKLMSVPVGECDLYSCGLLNLGRTNKIS